jgi:hypothetical protein
MASAYRKWVGRSAFLAVAALALANAGCIALAAGAAAAGAGGVAYAYFTAPLIHDYPTGVNDTAAATKLALADLQFPLVNEKAEDGNVVVESRTGDGYKIVVNLDVLASRVPADGTMTRVSVRVGHFGDDAVSARIHDQINLHLAPPPGRITPQAQAKSFETPPPPLAGPPPSPIQPVKRETKQP